MSEKSSASKRWSQRHPRVAAIVGASLWVVVSYLVGQLLVVAVFAALAQVGLSPLAYLDDNLRIIVAGMAVYAAMLLLLLGVPALTRHKWPPTKMLGLVLLPTWKDIGLALAGTVLFFIAAFFVNLLSMLLPWVDINQSQDLGFSAPHGIETVLIFVLLVVIAPIVEEIMFRGYLYGRMRQAGVAVWLATLVTSVLFGAVHLQWNVGITVFVLSVVMCIGRELTGSIWPGIIMHMIKNGLAFYILFVNPLQLGILGS